MADLNDFTTVNDTLKDNNAAEDRRDKRRLNQATSHSQKNEKNLENLLTGLQSSNENLRDSMEDSADKSTVPPSVKAEDDADDDAKHASMQDALAKIGGGINKLFNDAKNFVGDTPTVMQALLAAGGFFLLAEFLQSDMAASVVTTIIDSLTQLFGDIATLSKDFTVGGLIDLIKNNFLTLISILTT